jgi:hypothetical protein
MEAALRKAMKQEGKTIRRWKTSRRKRNEVEGKNIQKSNKRRQGRKRGEKAKKKRTKKCIKSQDEV